MSVHFNSYNAITQYSHLTSSVLNDDHIASKTSNISSNLFKNSSESFLFKEFTTSNTPINYVSDPTVNTTIRNSNPTEIRSSKVRWSELDLDYHENQCSMTATRDTSSSTSTPKNTRRVLFKNSPEYEHLEKVTSTVKDAANDIQPSKTASISSQHPSLVDLCAAQQVFINEAATQLCRYMKVNDLSNSQPLGSLGQTLCYIDSINTQMRTLALQLDQPQREPANDGTVDSDNIHTGQSTTTPELNLMISQGTQTDVTMNRNEDKSLEYQLQTPPNSPSRTMDVSLSTPQITYSIDKYKTINNQIVKSDTNHQFISSAAANTANSDGQSRSTGIGLDRLFRKVGVDTSQALWKATNLKMEQNASDSSGIYNERNIPTVHAVTTGKTQESPDMSQTFNGANNVECNTISTKTQELHHISQTLNGANNVECNTISTTTPDSDNISQCIAKPLPYVPKALQCISKPHASGQLETTRDTLYQSILSKYHLAEEDEVFDWNEITTSEWIVFDRQKTYGLRPISPPRMIQSEEDEPFSMDDMGGRADPVLETCIAQEQEKRTITQGVELFMSNLPKNEALESKSSDTVPEHGLTHPGNHKSTSTNIPSEHGLQQPYQSQQDSNSSISLISLNQEKPGNHCTSPLQHCVVKCPTPTKPAHENTIHTSAFSPVISPVRTMNTNLISPQTIEGPSFTLSPSSSVIYPTQWTRMSSISADKHKHPPDNGNFEFVDDMDDSHSEGSLSLSDSPPIVPLHTSTEPYLPNSFATYTANTLSDKKLVNETFPTLACAKTSSQGHSAVETVTVCSFVPCIMVNSTCVPQKISPQISSGATGTPIPSLPNSPSSAQNCFLDRDNIKQRQFENTSIPILRSYKPMNVAKALFREIKLVNDEVGSKTVVKNPFQSPTGGKTRCAVPAQDMTNRISATLPTTNDVSDLQIHEQTEDSMYEKHASIMNDLDTVRTRLFPEQDVSFHTLNLNENKRPMEQSNTSKYNHPNHDSTNDSTFNWNISADKSKNKMVSATTSTLQLSTKNKMVSATTSIVQLPTRNKMESATTSIVQLATRNKMVSATTSIVPPTVPYSSSFPNYQIFEKRPGKTPDPPSTNTVELVQNDCTESQKSSSLHQLDKPLQTSVVPSIVPSTVPSITPSDTSLQTTSCMDKVLNCDTDKERSYGTTSYSNNTQPFIVVDHATKQVTKQQTILDLESNQTNSESSTTQSLLPASTPVSSHIPPVSFAFFVSNEHGQHTTNTQPSVISINLLRSPPAKGMKSKHGQLKARELYRQKRLANDRHKTSVKSSPQFGLSNSSLDDALANMVTSGIAPITPHKNSYTMNIEHTPSKSLTPSKSSTASAASTPGKPPRAISSPSEVRHATTPQGKQYANQIARMHRRSRPSLLFNTGYELQKHGTHQSLVSTKDSSTNHQTLQNDQTSQSHQVSSNNIVSYHNRPRTHSQDILQDTTKKHANFENRTGHMTNSDLKKYVQSMRQYNLDSENIVIPPLRTVHESFQVSNSTRHARMPRNKFGLTASFERRAKPNS